MNSITLLISDKEDKKTLEREEKVDIMLSSCAVPARFSACPLSVPIGAGVKLTKVVEYV